jgi:hypothetical protein
VEKKAVREWLKLLPLQKRLHAIENIRKYSLFEFTYILNMKISKYLLLSHCFIFEKTRQGHDYWQNINNKYFL